MKPQVLTTVVLLSDKMNVMFAVTESTLSSVSVHVYGPSTLASTFVQRGGLVPGAMGTCHILLTCLKVCLKHTFVLHAQRTI